MARALLVLAQRISSGELGFLGVDLRWRGDGFLSLGI